MESLHKKKPNFRTTFRNQKGNIKKKRRRKKKKKCQNMIHFKCLYKMVYQFGVVVLFFYYYSKTFKRLTKVYIPTIQIEIYIKKNKNKKKQTENNRKL